MKHIIVNLCCLILCISGLRAQDQNYLYPLGVIEVTGSSTVSITPDRMTIEITMEEYYKKFANGDSVKVTISETEKSVRRALSEANVPDSLITITNIGSYYNYRNPEELVMSKTIAANLTELSQLEEIAEKMPERGVRNFRIAKLDNSEMELHNRRGLKAALDKAREKAAFIAENEGRVVMGPLEITEEGPIYYDEVMDEAVMTNVAMDSGSARGAMLKMASSMESMKKITRRYMVKVKYLFKSNE